MSDERTGRRDDGGSGSGGDRGAAPATVGGVPGQRSRVAARYGALGPALARRGDGDGDDPTIHDVATAAVEGKDGGRSIDGAVASRVGAHLGQDFAGVKVHDDPLARQATEAMGARAFAYGGDVFLGPGESDGDLGLMAHELTHVAQQGAAGARMPQRQVTVGAADSPAEREADAVAGEVTGGARPTALLVDDGPVGPGQMLKSTFIEQLRGQVTVAASDELGALSVVGCPYIDQYFGRYGGQPAAAGEAMLRRYAPATRGAADAAAMIPLVVTRVRDGVRQWRETGAVPADLPAGAVPDGGPAAAAMGPGAAMDGGTAARMSDALGDDVSAARIHVGPEAAAFAARHDALAITVGPHVAFARGAYQPGTPEGDALLAHELGHVAQQQGAAGGVPATDAGDALEDDADQVATGAMARLWGGAKSVAQRATAAMKSGLTMARCGGGPHQRLPGFSDPFVLSLFDKLTAHDEAGAFADLVGLRGSRAGDAVLRSGIREFVNRGLLTNAQGFRALVIQELGPDGRDPTTAWPDEVRNFADGVDDGVFTVSLADVPNGRDALRSFCMTAAGRLAEAGAGLAGEYRARFNGLWDMPPHNAEPDTFDETPGQGGSAPSGPNAAQDSKGPRNHRARSIFRVLYADASIQRAYDGNTPPGFREVCDTYAGPTGTNRIASPRLQQVRAALGGSAISPPATATTDPSYVTFLAIVQPLADQLDAADHAAIDADQQRWRALYEQKLAGSSDDVIAALRAVVERGAAAAPRARSPLSAPPAVSAPVPSSGGALPPTPGTPPTQPQLDFLRSITITAPTGPIDVDGQQHTLHFDVHSTIGNPGLTVERQVDVSPAAQALRGTHLDAQAWATNETSKPHDAVVSPETTNPLGETPFTAALTMPPYGAHFPTQTTTPVVVRDRRRQAFNRDIRPGLFFQEWQEYRSRTTPHLAYYGGQLPVTVEPYLAGHTNPGLPVFVRGVVRTGGAAVPGGTLAAQELRTGAGNVRVGDLVLNQPGPPNPGPLPTKDTYELALEYLSAPSGPAFHTPPPVVFDVTRAAPVTAPSAADAQTLIDDRNLLRTAPPAAAPAGDVRTSVREFLKFPPATAQGRPLSAAQRANCQRVEAGIASGMIPLEPMIVRSDSANAIANGGAPLGDPSHEVAYALGTMAPNDMLVSRPGWAGWRAFRGPAIYLNRRTDPADPSSERGIDELGMFAAHEAVHSADDPVPGWSTGTDEPFDHYRSEFRAYWMDGRYSALSTGRDDSISFGPKSPRANAIFLMIYGMYDHTRTNYDANNHNFRERADNYLYPDGINLIVSAALNDLKAAIRNTAGTFAVRHTRVQAAFTPCSADDRAEIRANRMWRDDVEAHFSTTAAPVPGAAPPRSEPARHQIKVLLGIPE